MIEVVYVLVLWPAWCYGVRYCSIVVRNVGTCGCRDVECPTLDVQTRFLASSSLTEGL